jgi:hypothetical protein
MINARHAQIRLSLGFHLPLIYTIYRGSGAIFFYTIIFLEILFKYKVLFVVMA